MSLYERRMVSEYGAQYEGRIGEQFENKPKPEFNKMKRSCKRILSELRNKPITVDFISKDGGDDSGDLAMLCDELYRSDEQDSVGDEAYDLCDDESIKGGNGSYRLIAAMEDDYDEWNDYQRIRFEPIPDSDQCVFWDQNSKRYDKADARKCIVLTATTRRAYKEEWGDDPASWPKDTENYAFEWQTPDLVYVAEAYIVDDQKEKVFVYESLDGTEERYSERDFDHDDTLRRILDATGWKLIETRSVRRRGVRKYIMSGSKILKDCGFIAGPNIPIVPQYGDRSFLNGIEVFSGHVRAAKDPQQLYNAIMSMLMNLASTGLQEKPIVAPEQIERFRTEWDNDNIDNYSVLRLDLIKDKDGNILQQGPIGYTKAPEVPPVMAQLIGIISADLNEILGDSPEAERMVSNVSGKLAELVQSYKDLPSFMYASNRAKSRRRGGEIWLGMAKELYVEVGRKMKAVNRSKKSRQVVLNEPALDKNGAFYERNNLSNASFDVYSDVGPSTASTREKILLNVQGFMQFAQADPQLMRVLILTGMKNFEGDEMDETRSWADTQLMEMGVREPTQEEKKKAAKEAENAPPNPEAELLLAEAGKSEKLAEKAEADTFKSLAQTKETVAKTAEIMSGIDRDDQQQVLDALETAVSAPPQN